MRVGSADAACTSAARVITHAVRTTVPASRRRQRSSSNSRKTAAYRRLIPARNARPRAVSAGFTVTGRHPMGTRDISS